MRASLLLLILLPALVACPSRRGGGGGGGDDDDSAGTPGPTSLAESLDYTSFTAIHPNDAGVALGFNECTMNIGAVVTRDPQAEGCALCVGVWSGPVTSQSSDCNGADVDPEVAFSFALADDGLEVWAWDDEAEDWTLSGVAVSSDGAWRLSLDQEMGEGDFSLGSMESEQAWQ